MKVKTIPSYFRDSNFNLNLLTFQLSNIRELETPKYTFEAVVLKYSVLSVLSLTYTKTNHLML